jgi:hypothetical protein
MAIRLALALLAAVLLGVWLWRRHRQADGSPVSGLTRADRLLRASLLFLCGFWSLTWMALALIRLPYAFELEWMGGSMRDHCLRILMGRPLYTPPDADWIPFLYPPLYYHVCAAVMRWTGSVSFGAMRAVSICATLGCSLLLYWWVVRALASMEPLGEGERNRHTARFWGVVAIGIFLAAYRLTGAWYDIERVDMLCLFFSLLGVALLRPSGVSLLFSAAFFSLAFLTKQQAAFFVFGGAAALAWMRAWRHLALFCAVALIVSGGSALALQAASRGWFGYYVFRIPQAAGMELHLARQYLFGDLPLFAPSVAALLLGLLAFRRSDRGGMARHPQMTVLLCMLAAGVISSWTSRAHWGGDQNVLIPGFVMIGTAACVMAGWWIRRNGRVSAPLYGLLLAQALTLTYRPDAQLPKPSNRIAGAQYARAVRMLEREGEVLSLDHGGFTASPRFHRMALVDVLRAERRLPEALIRALRERRYAAVVMDAKPENRGDLGEFLRSYPSAERLGIAASWILTGYPTPNETRRVWVLRPSAP